jgi:hypothetical protein
MQYAATWRKRQRNVITGPHKPGIFHKKFAQKEAKVKLHVVHNP